MKKLGVILLFAIAAFVFIGCSDDEGTALRWKNASYDNSGEPYDGIQWYKFGGGGSQTWNELPTETNFTAYKEVGFEYGRGEVLEGGAPTALRLELSTTDSDMAGVKEPSDNWVLLEKGSDATLVFLSITAK